MVLKTILFTSFLVFLANSFVEGQENEIKIGILTKNKELLVPVRKSLEFINADSSILPNIRLTEEVENIESDNSYQASRATCNLISRGVWVIIAPQSIQLTAIIRSITARHHIPLILLNWQPSSFYLEDPKSGKRNLLSENEAMTEVPGLLNYTINMYPMADQLSQAYLDLIRYKGWKSFTIIYDSPENLLLIKDVFELSFNDASIGLFEIEQEGEQDPMVASGSGMFLNSDDKIDIDAGSSTTLASDVGSGGNNRSESIKPKDSKKAIYCDFFKDEVHLQYRKLMKDVQQRKIENIILSVSLNKVCQILKEASNLGLLTVYHDFVIANLDLHLLNLTHFQPLVSNISGYSILDPSGQLPVDFVVNKYWLGKRPIDTPKRVVPTGYALVSDLLAVLAVSLQELISDPVVGPTIQPPNSDCRLGRAWAHGQDLMAIIKRSVRHGGYSGDIKFDSFGQRVDFNLEYAMHRNNSFHRVGDWNSAYRLEDKSKNADQFGFQAIKNQMLRVTVAKTSPYIMYRSNHTDFVGNNRYEGYCIDLLNKLAKKLQFKYQIQEVADGQYGKIVNGSWNGMVKELLDRKADLAIVDLTINKERQSAVDFTHPFMTLGIAIMYKKPKVEEAEMYSFLMPFSKEVWLSMGSAYVGMSLAMWLNSRLSPIEWTNPHPCIDNPDELELENEIHSIGASMWFNIGSLMQQGSDLAPRSPSVRTMGSVWFFFTLILISSYTANLAAFLTASRMQSPIENAADLSKQTKIDYGCKEGGATQSFFASSNHTVFRRMWNFMESRKHQGVFPTTNDKGISMVKKGNFAFLMESTSIEYMAQRDCELTQIGGLLDNKGYGIALRKSSPFRAALSKSIVELNEDGELQDLKSKWWNSPNGTTCTEQKDSALATSELGIDKVGGVFVLLGYGLVIACVAALAEFNWRSRKVPRDERVSIISSRFHHCPEPV